MSAVPDSGVELQIRGDHGVIIRFLELAVALQQGLKAHQIGELPGPGCLSGGLFLEENAHVVDLDDLLRIHLWYLQAPGYPLKESLLLETGQRLPDWCPGDAKAFSK